MKYLKGDWGFYKKTPPVLVNIGYCSEYFVGYTLRHKVRLFFGIHGNLSANYYFFNVPNWENNKIKKIMHKFMFKFGDKFLNYLINKIPLNI